MKISKRHSINLSDLHYDVYLRQHRTTMTRRKTVGFIENITLYRSVHSSYFWRKIGDTFMYVNKLNLDVQRLAGFGIILMGTSSTCFASSCSTRESTILQVLAMIHSRNRYDVLYDCVIVITLVTFIIFNSFGVITQHVRLDRISWVIEYINQFLSYVLLTNRTLNIILSQIIH